MTIFNLGSINIDRVYRVPRLPAPGETVAANDLSSGLGGKGANQSIAAAKAGSNVVHIGAIGTDGIWTLDLLRTAGTNVDHVEELDSVTGHAIINVDDAAENSIVLFPGANNRLRGDRIVAALEGAVPGDWFLLQNETNQGPETVAKAKELGLSVVYSAAPFVAEHAASVLPYTDLLIVNEIEAQQIREQIPDADQKLAEIAVLTTLGADGATYHHRDEHVSVGAFPVEPVDTTGAGDTWLGYFLAGLDQGIPVADAMRKASAAASIQVTRNGAATAIPTLNEVDAFLEGKP